MTAEQAVKLTKAMPFSLVDEEHELVRWVRADGEISDEAAAVAYFANEWGVTPAEVSVYRTCMYDPGPRCMCEDEATTGLRFSDGEKVMSCEDCAATDAEDIAPETFERIPLSEAVPYDGWPMQTCAPEIPGAVPYWRGEDA